jgi:hypothetical protein
MRADQVDQAVLVAPVPGPCDHLVAPGYEAATAKGWVQRPGLMPAGRSVREMPTVRVRHPEVTGLPG